MLLLKGPEETDANVVGPLFLICYLVLAANFQFAYSRMAKRMPFCN